MRVFTGSHHVHRRSGPLARALLLLAVLSIVHAADIARDDGSTVTDVRNDRWKELLCGKAQC